MEPRTSLVKFTRSRRSPGGISSTTSRPLLHAAGKSSMRSAGRCPVSRRHQTHPEGGTRSHEPPKPRTDPGGCVRIGEGSAQGRGGGAEEHAGNAGRRVWPPCAFLVDRERKAACSRFDAGNQFGLDEGPASSGCFARLQEVRLAKLAFFCGYA